MAHNTGACAGRRSFLKMATGAAVATALPFAAPVQSAVKRTATDWVTLGKANVKVTRLAFGTGTHGGRVQRELGQTEFTKLVRYAYERGIRFFETAENYRGMPEMLGKALEGIPRENYRLMTKLRWQNAANPDFNPFTKIDSYRRELRTDYFDILLLHNVQSAAWPTELEKLRDAFSEAKHKQLIRSHGCSGHGLLPIRQYAGNEWLDLVLMRVNHDGTRMDNLRNEGNVPGVREEVLPIISKVHGEGKGVIGMKIMGEGTFLTPEQRDASVKFVMQFGKVDAVTIGFKNTQEIDEAITRIDTHLNA